MVTILKWLKLCDEKLLHRGPLEWHHLPTKFHEILPIVPKDAHRFFIPKPSRKFLPCRKVHYFVTMDTSAKDGM
jgi:hypothetical protein